MPRHASLPSTRPPDNPQAAGPPRHRAHVDLLRTGALLALLVSAVPVQGQAHDRIWGRVVTTDGETREGFLRFHGELNAASRGDIFQSRQAVGSGPRDIWIAATRGKNPFLRTVELKGYRISWNDRSDDFPEDRPVHLPFGLLRAIVVQGDSVELALRGAAAGADSAGGRAGADLWSGESDRLRGQMDEDWPDTRIDVNHPQRGDTSFSAGDIGRIEFAAAPGGQEASSARLVGSVEDGSGRTYRGLITWDGRAVLRSDTLGRPVAESSRPAIRFDEVRSIERDDDGAHATLVSGEVVELTGGDRRRRRSVSVGVAPLVQVRVEGGGRRGDPAGEIRVVDPELGMVTIDWEDFSALHLEGGGAAGGVPGDFGGGAPLRGVVVTRDGEEIEGRIRWNALKEWTWDRLYANSDGVEIATGFGKILGVEQIAFPDLPPEMRPVTGQSLPGLALVTYLDGSTREMRGYNDLGSGNLGILVRAAASGGAAAASRQGAADAADGWRFVAWDDVREVRFVHDREEEPGS